MRNIMMGTLILVLVFVVSSRPVEQGDISQFESWEQYLALQPGRYSSYSGKGMEFAAFNQEVTYVQPPLYQVEEESGGTTMVYVYLLGKDEIYKIYQEGEFYEDKNILPSLIKEAGTTRPNKLLEFHGGQVLFQGPITVGKSWQAGDQKVEITAILEEMQVGAGNFYNVVKIKKTIGESETYEYYAPNIGMIKSLTDFDGDHIISELEYFKIGERPDGFMVK
ncbi:MAG: hypothetical protein ACQEQG_03195 [Bacillota bacterium]